MAEQRYAQVHRKTNETDISLTLTLDGNGKQDIATGIGFFDHMLSGFTRHGFFDLDLKVAGDLEVDCHHTIEDTGIVLGNAVRQDAACFSMDRMFTSTVICGAWGAE